MAKLVDIEIIKAEIERRIAATKDVAHRPCHRAEELRGLLSFLDTLEESEDSIQDQPDTNCNGLQEQEEDDLFKEFGTTTEEYLAKAMDKVHLEMELATYIQDWEDDEEIGLHLSTDHGDFQILLDDIRDLARHFYELGKKAK